MTSLATSVFFNFMLCMGKVKAALGDIFQIINTVGLQRNFI
jgi:hypothetical protein